MLQKWTQRIRILLVKSVPYVVSDVPRPFRCAGGDVPRKIPPSTENSRRGSSHEIPPYFHRLPEKYSVRCEVTDSIFQSETAS